MNKRLLFRANTVPGVREAMVWLREESDKCAERDCVITQWQIIPVASSFNVVYSFRKEDYAIPEER